MEGQSPGDCGGKKKPYRVGLENELVFHWDSESHLAVFWKWFEWGPKDVSEREIDLCVRSNRRLEVWNKKI